VPSAPPDRTCILRVTRDAAALDRQREKNL
jgi:hypothetical protein